jgi:hypothetical protein
MSCRLSVAFDEVAFDEDFNSNNETGGVEPPVLCLDSPLRNGIQANVSELGLANLFSISRLM